METLDLTTHTTEEIAGKYITIGKINYFICPKVYETDDYTEYPVQNVVSKLTYFSIKVMKYVKGTKEYDYTLHLESIENFKGQCVLGIKSIVDQEHLQKVNIVPSVIFEQNGGLIKFQRLMHGIENTEYEEDTMKFASTCLSKKDFKQAFVCYYEILEKNPKHDMSMVNIANIVHKISDIENKYTVALDWILQAINIEPNNTKGYASLAKLLILHNSNDEEITKILKAAWLTYPIDFEFMNLLFEYMTLIQDYEFTGLLLKYLKGIKIDQSVVEHYESKTNKIETIKEILKKVELLNDEKKWEDSLKLLNKSFEQHKPEGIVFQMNMVICQFHRFFDRLQFEREQSYGFMWNLLNGFKNPDIIKLHEEINDFMPTIIYLVEKAPDAYVRNSLFLMQSLFYTEIKEYKNASTIFQFLNNAISHIMDLHGVPTFYNNMLNEQKDVTMIKNALKINIQHADSFKAKEALVALQAKYIKYENEIK